MAFPGYPYRDRFISSNDSTPGLNEEEKKDTWSKGDLRTLHEEHSILGRIGNSGLRSEVISRLFIDSGLFNSQYVWLFIGIRSK